MSQKRRNHSPDFKVRVALAAIKDDRTLSEIAKRFAINANFVLKYLTSTILPNHIKVSIKKKLLTSLC